MIGSEIGHYKIVERLGAGGMGEVYRAEDTTLGRPVALKFLASHLLHDEEAKQRFLREARAAAAVRHPNICHVYEVGEESGKTFLAMDYLEGETLEDRITKGPLPLKDALDIGRQIAEGLEAAHEKGIVHRDIKPANVMIDAKGRATILDFGLARLTEASKLTRADQTVGTAAYMSPEQIQGGEVDHRTDIWALGCVLYEMVAGVRPFKGQYDQALAYEIVQEQPEPLTAVRAGLPMDLDFIVGKCLAKEPGDRPATAQEVVRELRTLADKVKSGRSTVFSVAGGAAGSMAARPPVVAGGRSKRERLAWGVAALLAAGLAVLAVLYFGQPSPELETSRFEIAPPSGIRFARRAAQISPDGRHLVFVGMSGRNVRSLWIRSMDSVEARPLNGTEGAEEPFWSPDSRFVGFFADGKLKKIDIAGGPAQTLCDASAGRGGTWAAGATGDTGVIVFAATALGSLQEVSDAGGEPAAVTILDVESGDRSHRYPHFLPDGRRFLYTARAAGRSEVRVGSLDERPGEATKKHEPILIADTPVRYAPPSAGKGNGYLLFAREDSLMAQELDLDSLKLTGQPVPVAEGVGESTSGMRNNDFSASRKGTLTYRAGDSAGKAQLTWFSRDGKRGETVGEPGWHGGMVSLSPDDSKVATTLFGDEMLPNGDLWIHDLSRGVASRFTFHPSQEMSSVWSPDGKRIVFSSNREGQYDLYLKPTSGAGDAELLLHSDFIKGPRSWSPDGKTILYVESTGRGDYDLWTLPLDGDRKPAPFLRTEFNEVLGQFSPDDRWVAYVSNESGREEVYVQPYPASGGKWQVSTDGGSQPRWRADGKEMFYLSQGDTMMAAAVEADTIFRPGVPAELFRVSGIVVPSGPGSYFHYDVTKDGERFLIDVTSEEGEQTPITVVQNWQAELGR